MATNAVFIILCLIGAQYLLLTDGAAYELAARKNSIYASITQDEFGKLAMTLMDVVETNGIFKAAYRETSAKRNEAINTGKSYGLTEEETLAVMIYTTDFVHAEFNRILREGDTEKYDESFQVFHYLLINAIEKIRLKQTLPEILYRGDKNIYLVDTETKMRLPGYTSTSCEESVAERFRDGNGTLIYLKGVTLGANITPLSVYDDEKEVLIPPYERFIVTDVGKDNKGPVIHLHSIGELCGGRRRRSTGGPCQCCRLPLDQIQAAANRGVLLQMKWNVACFYLMMYMVGRC